MERLNCEVKPNLESQGGGIRLFAASQTDRHNSRGSPLGVTMDDGAGEGSWQLRVARSGGTEKKEVRQVEIRKAVFNSVKQKITQRRNEIGEENQQKKQKKEQRAGEKRRAEKAAREENKMNIQEDENKIIKKIAARVCG